MKYFCHMCGYIYDEKVMKVKWEDLPSDYKCPVCGAPNGNFYKLEEEEE